MSPGGIPKRQVQIGMEILSAKTCIRPATTACTVSEHLFKEIGEAACTASGKLLPVGRVPVCTAPVRTETGTALTTEACTAEAAETSCTGLLPCPLLSLKFIGMLPVFAIFIILLSFLRITKHLIGLVDSLKLVFGSSVIRIQVGMIFARQLTERLLDVILRCRFVYSKDLIIINVSHSL